MSREQPLAAEWGRLRGGGTLAFGAANRPRQIGVAQQLRDHAGGGLLLGGTGTSELVDPAGHVLRQLLHDLGVARRIAGDVAQPLSNERVPVHGALTRA